MPAANANDHLVPVFDLDDDPVAPAAPPQKPSAAAAATTTTTIAASPDDPWNFAGAAAAVAKKKKKKGKKEKGKETPIAASPPVTDPSPPLPPTQAAGTPSLRDVSPVKEIHRVEQQQKGGEDVIYDVALTPSPPKVDEGVKIRTVDTFPVPAAAVAVDIRPPSPIPNFDDDTTAWEESDPVPSPRLANAKVSPVLKSPRLAHARPVVQPPASPPSRVSTLHTVRDRDRSISGQRPVSGSVPGQGTTTGLAPRSRTDSLAGLSTSPRARFVEPPPPHLPQAHFWGLPDLGLHLKSATETGRPAGADGYCCSLDTFTEAGDDASARKARDAVLVGCEGGLDVFRVLPNKLEIVGRLEGLRGAVLAARILPHGSKYDALQPLRPLVAVIVHGPAAGRGRTAAAEDASVGAGAIIDFADVEAPPAYQTSVEVYSLQTQQLVTTLYQSVAVPVEPPMGRQVPVVAPPPIGDLSLSAEGNFVAVASGKSGEVWVFSAAPHLEDGALPFRCLGKFWTTLQSPIGGSSTDANAQGADVPEPPRRPIFSLSARWLALVAPSLSSAISIAGTPSLAPGQPAPPGVASHNAPPPPPVTCAVVGTDEEAPWRRLGRQAALGLVKYSQKGIEMSWQGWRELTHPSPQGNNATGGTGRDEQLFPPTKGPADDPGRRNREPVLISVIDLVALLDWEAQAVRPKHPPAPLATFALAEGCSFLSLSATGLRLLTASRKGEVSMVWDLTQIAHGVPRRRHGPTKHTGVVGNGHTAEDDDDDAGSGPCVRPLHRIVRNTPATVLECAWAPDDVALALLTAHGTVHLHEVPAWLASSAAARKRKRRSHSMAGANVLPPPVEKADAMVGLSAAGSPPSSSPGFLGSLKSGWQSVSTQVGSMRGGGNTTTNGDTTTGTGEGNAANSNTLLGLPTTFAGFREATAAAGSLGSRVVARGLSQGYSAAKGGARDYWHADDNKIRLKTAPSTLPAAAIGTLRWIRRPQHPQQTHHGGSSSGGSSAAGGSDGGRAALSLAVVAAGQVQVHPVSRVAHRNDGTGTVVRVLKHEKSLRRAFVLPPLPAPAARAAADAERCAAQGPHGFWSLRTAAAAVNVAPPALGSSAGRYGQSQAQSQQGYHARRPSSQQQQPQGYHPHAAPAVRPSYHDITDVETNPPYCPFHVDPRVAIFAFDETSGPQAAKALAAFARLGHVDPEAEPEAYGHGKADSVPWVFGTPLPARVRMNERVLEEGGGVAPEEDDFAAFTTDRGGGGDLLEVGSDEEADRAGYTNPTAAAAAARFQRRYQDIPDEDDDDDDPDALASQVESRLTVQSAGSGRAGAEEEIRINTRLRVVGGAGAAGTDGGAGGGKRGKKARKAAAQAAAKPWSVEEDLM